MIANPFLSHYPREDLVRRSTAVNLFWILVLMVTAGLALFVATFLDTALVGSVVQPILLGFIAFSLVALLFLTVGRLSLASNLAFSALLAAMTAVSLFSRTGSTEADLTQATALFFLGLLVLSPMGVNGLLATFWVLVGTGTLIWICVVPEGDAHPGLTLASWNASFNPATTLVLYLVGALAGTLLLIQGRRNLKLMQFDQEIIQTTNQMLEETVEERTQSLRTILDSSGQGLFTFRADYLVEPDYSQGARNLFAEEIAGEAADTLLFPHAAETRQDFRQGLSLYFAGKAKASVIFDLLEKETYLGGRFLEIGYKEAGPGRILCVLTDVTLDRQLADLNRADEARRNLVLKALGHKRFFAGLLAEAEALFQILRGFEDRPANETESRSLLTSVHTFKGNCGFFGFTSTQEMAHDFEYAIQDSLTLGESLDLHDLGLDLKRTYYQELNVIIDALGKGWLEEAGGILVPRDVYDKLARYVSKKYAAEANLIEVLEHYRKMPLRDLFSRFPFIAQATGEKLGKRLAPMEVRGGEMRVLPESIEALVGSCVHIVNNMVDHGIEPTYVRESLGKPPEGHLILEFIRTGESVIIQFSDDGHGVDLAAVEARARATGFLADDVEAVPQDLLQMLFAPGFSTKAEATEISGRGVGLAAVRREAEALGGRIEVHSRDNVGTTFEIILPIENFVVQRKKP